MNRDETVALFLKGRGAWNAWAKQMLAEKKALEEAGRWGDEEDKWARATEAGFSRCLFFVRRVEGTKEAAGEKEEAEGAPVKSIEVDGEIIDFSGFVFPGDANFESAAFSGPANFRGAAFSGPADFQSATFSSYANFERAAFSGRANFESAAFSGCAYFQSAAFSGYANFESAAFSGRAYFQSAAFSGYANFESAAFSGNAYFRSATFSAYAFFRGQTFTNDVFFNGAKFGPRSRADFGLATFERVVQFDGASFEGEADFDAVWVRRTFSLAQARFKGVPDFIQAHFEEAPRLDNVVVEGRLIEPQEDEPGEGEKPPRPRRLHRWLKARSARYRRVTAGIAQGSALRDMPARWRALKRLAIQGHDTDRELQFFSGEIRSQRFAELWPLPWPVWKLKAWGWTLGFWVGLLYQIFSNFGRSVVRPFVAWVLCIVIFAIYFLGQNAEMTMRRDHHYPGWLPAISEYARTAWKALRTPPYCYPGTPPKLDEPRPPEKRPDDIQTGLSGLVEEVRAETNLVNEALSIAYHNAVIILDSSGDSANRAFGCLYGVERYGGNPVAYVPRSVAIASGIQKLLSAIFIFLFGLAVRNMLKMK